LYQFVQYRSFTYANLKVNLENQQLHYMSTTSSLQQPSANSTSTSRANRPTFTTALLLTALIAGTLDAIGATTSFLLRGNGDPAIIWRYVASGALGPAALKGGGEMVVYGLLFHYFIAFCCTLVFFLAYPRVRALARYKYIAAIGYALLVWVITNLVIIPLSHLGMPHFHLQQVLIGMFILVLAIGLPISLLAHRWIRP
jgi:hypothetical protein